MAKFGIEPDGRLLDVVLDLERSFGVAYERCLNFKKAAHSHPRVVICAARGATVSDIKDEKTGRKYQNTSEVVVIKPPGFLHSIESRTSIYEDISFLPTVEFVRKVGVGAGYAAADIQELLASCHTVQRSAWLSELIDQYFRRRILTSPATPFQWHAVESLEREIIWELYWLALGHGKERPERFKSLSGPVAKTVDYVESKLFVDLQIEDMAKIGGCSRSVLLRQFKAELGCAPLQYVRRRRLEEAKHFLAQPGRSVSEVAELVGYEDTSAFCRAYRKMFGQSPGND